jgi:hypothetical protein
MKSTKHLPDRYEDFLKEWILVGHKTTGNPMLRTSKILD